MNCPDCGHRILGHAATDADPGPPQRGDLSVCMGCGGWMVFGDRQEIRSLSEAEIAAMDSGTFLLLQRVGRLRAEIMRKR